MATTKTKSAKKKQPKDANAPKRPQNAYTIFFRHYMEQWNKKVPSGSFDSKQLSIQIGKAWRELTERDKQPFHEKANAEKDRYANEMQVYKTTNEYRQFQKKQIAKMPDVPVFSKEFLAHNKNREAELRNLRKEISGVEEKAQPLLTRIEGLMESIGHLEKVSGRRDIIKKERMLSTWTRKLIPELQKGDLMKDLQLKPDCTPEALIQALEACNDNRALMDRLRKSMENVYLPVS